MIYFIIASVTFGLAINMVMNAKKAKKDDIILASRIDNLRQQLIELRKFVNMPEPVEPPEEE